MDLCLRYLARPFAVCYGLDIVGLYRQFMELTDNPLAASNLVLAAVHADQQPEETLLDSAQAAKVLGVSKSLVQALARDGQLRSIRVGKLVKFKRQFLEEYLKPKPYRGAHW